MKTVKIYFVDFWDGFDPNNNFFTRLLSVKYDLVIDPVSPDYVFYSCFSSTINSMQISEHKIIVTMDSCSFLCIIVQFLFIIHPKYFPLRQFMSSTFFL